jgi:hypothetical protein
MIGCSITTFCHAKEQNLVQAGSMRLEIAAERSPGFDEPIEVQMLWNPPGVGSQSEAAIPKGATNVFYQLNAAGGAETRTWKIAVLGHATVESGPLYVSSQLAPLEVAAPYLAGKIQPLSPPLSGRTTNTIPAARAGSHSGDLPKNQVAQPAPAKAEWPCPRRASSSRRPWAPSSTRAACVSAPTAPSTKPW